MAEADWQYLTTGFADQAQISTGYHDDPAFDPRHGGSVLGFHSLQVVTGASAWACSLTGFAPIVAGKGGVIIACMRKFTLANGYSPFIFMANSNSAYAECYKVGLSHQKPYRIVMARSLLEAPLETGLSGNLGESTAEYDDNRWFNLRLIIGVWPQGDVRLTLEMDTNDPINPAAPAFAAVPGASIYYDDKLGIFNQTPALIGSFYAGVGHANVAASGRVSVFDYIRIARQTAP